MARKFLQGVDLRSQRAQNVASASALTDAPNWGQVQNLFQGRDFKDSVRAASTGNINIASPGTTLDSYTMVSGDRVLLKNQTTASQNGIYIFNGSASAMTRAADFVDGEVSSGATCVVENNGTQAKTQWTLQTSDPITVGTTSLSFTQTGVGFVYSAGTWITISPSGVIAVDTTKVPGKFSQAVGDGSSTTIVVTHNLGTTDTNTELYDASTGEKVETDITARTTSTITLSFAVAPATSAYRIVVLG